MKIGIDIREVSRLKTGKGQYTFHIVKELLQQDQKNEYILYTNNLTVHLLVFPQANVKLIHKNPVFWHFAVIQDFIKEGGELFFAPTSFIIPAFLPKKIKSIISIHDLIAFLHPHLHKLKATILEQLFFRIALKKTQHVLVPSENTKQDLMRLFHYPEEKITVTSLGVEQKKYDMNSGTFEKIRKKYALPKDFVLTVSGLEPRKNVTGLLEAFLKIMAQPMHKNLKLVIVGGKGWKSKQLAKKIATAKNHIIHIENCETEDLLCIYRLAKIFVFPSLYEGFGLPPLEAMAMGCPIICSKTSSLPEVCGDAAVFIDPKDVESITQAIEKVLGDEKLREKLREKGFTQAKKFTWKKTAEKTLFIIAGTVKQSL